jgi:MFS family permease
MTTPRRSATLLAFAALGLFWGAWAAVLPSVQHATGASKGALGFALLFVSVGSLPAMLLVAGPAVDRYGPRAVSVACAVFAASTTLPGLATSLPALILALLATGAASGALDVGINANAAQIEAATARRLMPLAHALYSVGVLVGAVGAGLASRSWSRSPCSSS